MIEYECRNCGGVTERGPLSVTCPDCGGPLRRRAGGTEE
ncbi:rubrerythrin-like domain-containing protein [Halomicrobium salinisoli]|nr:rubrerythrin-like domain-containing protein [Halomicrobium salinisoli]